MARSPLSRFCIFAFLLLTGTGCGTVYRGTRSVGKAWDYLTNIPVGNHSVDPPVIGATDIALGVFVYAGLGFLVIGVLMCLFSITRHHGLIMIAGGLLIAFAGHVFEEYAHMVVMSSIGGSTLFIVYKISRKSGYELGFEHGKDFKED